MLFEEIKGLTPELAAKLKAKGIASAEGLLKAGKTPQARKSLAEELGLDAAVLTEYLNRADLVRVKGVGGVYANLLEEAGVDTIKELATRVPANLQAKIVEVNAAKKLTAKLPTVGQVEAWVSQAKQLPKLIEY